MAIKIPSSKIYEMQNPKIRDNIVQKIEVTVNNAKTSVNENQIVYSSTETDFSKHVSERIENSNAKLNTSLMQGYSAYTFAYVGYGDRKYAEITLRVPTRTNNSYLEKLYLLYKAEEGYSINYTITGKIEQGSANGRWRITGNYGSYNYEIGTTTFSPSTISENENITDLTINGDEKLFYSQIDGSNLNLVDTAKAEVEFKKDDKTLAKSTATIQNKGFEDEYYLVTLKIPCDITMVKVGAYNLIEGSRPSLEGGMNVSGYYKKYIAEKIELSFLGKLISLSLTENVNVVGDSNSKKVISIEGNELRQATNYFSDTGDNAVDIMYGNMISQYSNGKETATIRCSIGDYYDYDDQAKKVIAIDNSTSKMAFEEYDQVIPMVYGADGVDRPMSLKLDGSPKVFTVLGTKIFYDGAIFQEISLQEA